MAVGFVGEKAGTCTYASADECASWTTHFRADDGTTDGTSADELSLGVVAVIVAMSLGDGVFVRLLRGGTDGDHEDGGGDCGCCECLEFRGYASSAGLLMRLKVGWLGNNGQMSRININWGQPLAVKRGGV